MPLRNAEYHTDYPKYVMERHSERTKKKKTQMHGSEEISYIHKLQRA
jgi:hypothetical protein